MRIISGRARGTHLLTPADERIRPTSDRVRESLFNILAHLPEFTLRNAVVADLFCGTGALGLEALSRGAAHCVFADRSQSALDLARKNIAKTRFEDQSLCLKTAADKVARHPRLNDIRFDLVFLDPPYRQDLAPPVIHALLENDRIQDGCLFIVEMAEDAPEDITHPALTRLQTRQYGQTRIDLYQKA
jgi:16S rRNA (guanine966-N2)-methyltransferase